MEKKFPKDFLWGVAHASHQVEGNSKGNDWGDWEQQGKTKESSGWACDSWNRYPIDNKLAQELGCDAFRISFEWFRIEPKKGKFSKDGIEHYRKNLQDMKKRGLKRVVTLWHWTSPMWFVEDGGWHSEHSVEHFTSYCSKIIEELGDEIDMFITINEPRLPLNRGYLKGDFPPGKRNPKDFLKARKNMIKAHRECYDICKKKQPKIPVGITQFCNVFEYTNPKSFLWSFIKKMQRKYNWYFQDQIKDKQDFVGINYYFGMDISLLPPFAKMKNDEKKLTEMGWGVYPNGLFELLISAWGRYKKPVYIFENGISDEKDTRRAQYIKVHTEAVRDAIAQGANVKGYFYWSLLDNFEWLLGYSRKFGLCEIDKETMDRIPRKSYFEYQKLIAGYKGKSQKKRG
ncbi:glycoside hydrolase family 1 protein [bacterium]|nr:glycoside hydrolase family 1 protein [bacterium]